EGFRGQTGASHELCQGRVLEVGQTSSQLRFGQKQVPQPGGPRLDLELFDNGCRLPAIALAYLLVKDCLRGEHVFLHEGIDALAQLFDLGGITEIHASHLADLLFMCNWYRKKVDEAGEFI